MVPVVDLKEVRRLGEALEEYGFVSVTGHGVDPALLAAAYVEAERLFGLPAASKRRHETPEDGRQRGYTPFGLEHAKDQPQPDLKEFWHFGRTVPADHPLALSGELRPNRYPEELGEGAAFLALYDALDGFALRLLDAVGAFLEQPPAFFRDMVRDGNSVLRVIHYPALANTPVGAVRAAPHEDINLMTALPASTRPGLELMTRDGRWVPVETPPGVLICDTGDMMALLTAGRLPATTHRVVNPEAADGGRFSMPFFVHPRPDYLIEPLAPGFGQPVTAKDFLRRRLRETGVA